MVRKHTKIRPWLILLPRARSVNQVTVTEYVKRVKCLNPAFPTPCPSTTTALPRTLKHRHFETSTSTSTRPRAPSPTNKSQSLPTRHIADLESEAPVLRLPSSISPRDRCLSMLVRNTRPCHNTPGEPVTNAIVKRPNVTGPSLPVVSANALERPASFH